MAIKNSNKRGLFYIWTHLFFLFLAGLFEIQYNRNPIFIIIPRRSIMSIGGIPQYQPLRLRRYLGWLDPWNHLAQRTHALVLKCRGSDPQSVDDINSLLDPFGLDAFHQTLETLRSSQALHAGHHVYIVEVANIAVTIIATCTCLVFLLS